jgi:hypothetical protein
MMKFCPYIADVDLSLAFPLIFVKNDVRGDMFRKKRRVVLGSYEKINEVSKDLPFVATYSGLKYTESGQAFITPVWSNNWFIPPATRYMREGRANMTERFTYSVRFHQVVVLKVEKGVGEAVCRYSPCSSRPPIDFYAPTLHAAVPRSTCCEGTTTGSPGRPRT